MLDLSHPMTKHVFAASRAEDAILIAARRMTVAHPRERFRLWAGCAPAFAELRRLARDHFTDHPALPTAIDALELAVTELAALRVRGTAAEDECPTCGAALDRPCCVTCLQVIIPALTALRSRPGGFGTFAI